MRCTLSGFPVARFLGAATIPTPGLAVNVPLAEPRVPSLQVRHKWLDAPVYSSPLL